MQAFPGWVLMLLAKTALDNIEPKTTMNCITAIRNLHQSTQDEEAYQNSGEADILFERSSFDGNFVCNIGVHALQKQPYDNDSYCSTVNAAEHYSLAFMAMRAAILLNEAEGAAENLYRTEKSMSGREDQL